MKRLSVPTDQIAKFAGKWVVIDPKTEHIIAVADTFKEISPLVTVDANEKKFPGELPVSFLVPRKGEGPYVLCINLP